MGATVDDMTPLGAGGRRDWVATAKVVAKVIGVVTPAIVGAVVAVRVAIGDAAARVQGTKDKAEAGYQVTKDAMERFERRFAALETALHRLEAAQAAAKRPAGRRPPAPAPAPTPPAAAPKVLPRDLDQAQRQVYQGAPPAPARRGDAAP